MATSVTQKTPKEMMEGYIKVGDNLLNKKQDNFAFQAYEQALACKCNDLSLKVGLFNRLIYNVEELNVPEIRKRLIQFCKDYSQSTNDPVLQGQSSGVIGKALFDSKEYAKAEKAYRRAIELNPTDVYLPKELSLTLYKLNRHEEAVALLNEAIAKETDESKKAMLLREGLLPIYRYQNQHEEAISVLKQLLKSPIYDSFNRENLFHELGDFYSTTGKFTEAAKAFIEAIKLNPLCLPGDLTSSSHPFHKDGIAYGNKSRIGLLFIKLGKACEELKSFENTFQKFNHEHFKFFAKLPYDNINFLKLITQTLESNILRGAKVNDLLEKELFQQLGIQNFTQESPKKVMEVNCPTTSTSQPKKPVPHHNDLSKVAKKHLREAKTHYEQKQYDKAIEAFQNGLKTESNDLIKIQLLSGLGDAFHRIKDYDKAIEYFLKAIELNQKACTNMSITAGLFTRIGRSYYQTKQYAKALEAFEKAVNIADKESELYKQIQILLEKTNKKINK